MSSLRRRLLMQCMKNSAHIYATRVLDNVQLNYLGKLISKTGERVYQFELEEGKTYSIKQQSDVTGYCRTRGWSTTAIDISGQVYNDSLSTAGCTVALGGVNYNTVSTNVKTFIAKAKYLYVYNQSVTTSFSNTEIYLDEVTL